MADCVDTIAVEGEAGLIGDVTFSAGDGIVLTQAGQDIEVALEPMSPTTQLELLGDEANSHGITITADAAAHTKGLYSTLGTTSFDANGFYVQLVPGTQAQLFLVDIAIGGIGSEVVIVSNIYIASNGVSGGNFPFANPGFYVPLPIPSGTRVSARCQSGTAGSDTIWASVVPVAGDIAAAMQKTTATTYGANTATTTGVTVDPGASVNTNGTAAELSASVNAIDYALVCINTPQTPTASWFLELCVGAAAAETTVVPGIQVRCHSSYGIPDPTNSVRWAHWDAAARLSARARCSINTATARNLIIVVIGFS